MNYGRSHKKMEYEFEKIIGKKEYQVRLNGEFITYSETKDPKVIDAILKENGWKSREEYFDYVINNRW